MAFMFDFVFMSGEVSSFFEIDFAIKINDNKSRFDLSEVMLKCE